MKTTLIDTVKMNGTEANVSRIKSATTRSVDSKEFRSSADNSGSSFNKTLQEEQKSSETKFEVTAKKPERSPEKEAKAEETKETDETVVVEAPDKQPEETETVEKAEEQGIPVQSAETGEKTDGTEVTLEKAETMTDSESVKTKTLISLLSGDKKAKFPNVESYIANLRDEGKSTKEILTSLKKVVNDLEEKPEATLKDYVLKVRRLETEDKTESVTEKGKLTGIVSEQKKLKTAEPQVKTEPVKVEPEKSELVGKMTDEGHSEQNSVESDVIKVDEFAAEAQNDQTSKVDQKSKTKVEEQTPVADEEKGKTKQTVDLVIPEKLAKFLENHAGIDFEKVSSFFESKLIPQEEVEKFISSFNVDEMEEFIEKNESVISQLSDFSKLFDGADNETVFSQIKTGTVRTVAVQQFIAKSFSTGSFSDDFWNDRNNLVFKTKESSQIVQKMAVSFERITQSVRTEIRQIQSGITTMTSKEPEEMRQNSQSSGKVGVNAAFLRTGYESPISRRSSITQVSEQSVALKEDSGQKTEVFQGQLKQIDEFKESVEKLQNRSADKVETKGQNETKEARESLTGEHTNHSNEKTNTSLTTTVLNRQSVNSPNLEQVYQRISDMTKMMERQMVKVETATIQLTPPELGKVSLEVVKEGAKISIFMQVETKEAQEILQRNSETLAARLSSSGFELQKVQVQMEKYEEQETIHQLEIKFGFNENILVQYGKWLVQVLQGNFGHSFQYHQPVYNIIWGRLGATLLLSITTLVISWVLGIGLGIFAAMRQYKLGDQVASVVALIGLSIPNFFFALLFLYMASKTGWFPIGGMTSINNSEMGFFQSIGDYLWHVAGPAITLGFSSLAGVMRQMRGQFLDQLGMDYVEFARAKGMPRKVVVYKHALRNAINPLITMFGYTLSSLLGGAVLTEQVFSWPGMGRLTIQALNSQDLYLVMASLLLSSLMLVIGNLSADLLLAAVDPRVRKRFQ